MGVRIQTTRSAMAVISPALLELTSWGNAAESWHPIKIASSKVGLPGSLENSYHNKIDGFCHVLPWSTNLKKNYVLQ